MEDMRGYFLIVLVCLVSVSEIQIKMNAGQYWTSDPSTPWLYLGYMEYSFGIFKIPENAFLLQKCLDIAHVDHNPSNSWCNYLNLAPFTWVISRLMRQVKWHQGKTGYCVTGCNGDRPNFKMPPDSSRITSSCDSSVLRARTFRVFSNGTHSECSTSLRSDHFSYFTQLVANLFILFVIHKIYVCVYVLFTGLEPYN